MGGIAARIRSMLDAPAWSRRRGRHATPRSLRPLDPLIDEWIARQADAPEVEAKLQPQWLPNAIPDEGSFGGDTSGEDENAYHLQGGAGVPDVADAADAPQAEDAAETEAEDEESVVPFWRVRSQPRGTPLQWPRHVVLQPTAGVQATGEVQPMPHSPRRLDEMADNEVDELSAWVRLIALREREGAMAEARLRVPRRKRVDARATIRLMAKSGGRFTRFRYREGPLRRSVHTRPLELVVVGDVSGSMGRYVAIVVHLLAHLHATGRVHCYLFSDEPTRVSGLARHRRFREQYGWLKQQAKSWGYGTRLASALEEIRRDGLYTSQAVVVLITDGGFSLVGDDWSRTVHHLVALKQETRGLVVVTPNPLLADEGPRFAEALWDVVREPLTSYELLSSPQRMITARLGLLSRYSDAVLACHTIADAARVVEEVLALSWSTGGPHRRARRMPQRAVAVASPSGHGRWS